MQGVEHSGAVGVFGVSDLRNLRRGGGVEEEFGSLDGGADGVGGCRRAAEFAVFRFDLCRVRAVFLTAGQGQAADGGDTC